MHEKVCTAYKAPVAANRIHPWALLHPKQLFYYRLLIKERHDLIRQMKNYEATSKTQSHADACKNQTAQ